MQTVQVSVTGGPSVEVPWFRDMNAQQALEGAYTKINSSSVFTYALQYYGSSLGYLVVMMNETYDSFISTSEPFFYWQFSVNGVPATKGIDGVTLNPGDAISFTFEMYTSATHKSTTLEIKHKSQLLAAQGRA
jgi:Domain of unknown function (DUF4430)